MAEEAVNAEKVVLVCLGNRTREVRFCGRACQDDVEALEHAVLERFADVGSLKKSSQLILQVCHLLMQKFVYT